MLPCHTCRTLTPYPQSLTYFSGLYFTDLYMFVLGLGYGPDVKTGQNNYISSDVRVGMWERGRRKPVQDTE